MVTHYTVHEYLARERGPARNHTCVECGKPADEWAYQHTGETQYGKTSDGVNWDSLPYSEDLNDYAPMCRSCHRRLDKTYLNYGKQAVPRAAVPTRSP